MQLPFVMHANVHPVPDQTLLQFPAFPLSPKKTEHAEVRRRRDDGRAQNPMRNRNVSYVSCSVGVVRQVEGEGSECRRQGCLEREGKGGDVRRGVKNHLFLPLV